MLYTRDKAVLTKFFENTKGKYDKKKEKKMKTTSKYHFCKSMEEIKDEILKKSIAEINSKITDLLMKRFMSLDKIEQRHFIVKLMSR
jgi:predicted transcriptional regulator